MRAPVAGIPGSRDAARQPAQAVSRHSLLATIQGTVVGVDEIWFPQYQEEGDTVLLAACHSTAQPLHLPSEPVTQSVAETTAPTATASSGLGDGEAE